MRKLMSLVVVLSLCGTIIADDDSGENKVVGEEESVEDKVKFDLSVDFFGKYVFRGMNLVDEPVLQPKVSANYKGLTGCVWGNMDLTDKNGNDFDITENDYFLEYTSDLSDIQIAGLEIVSYTVGAVHYDFTGFDLDDTTEVYWGLDFDLPLEPSVKVYHDVDEADGTYAVLRVGHTTEKITINNLGEKSKVGVNIGLSLGMGTTHYNDNYWGTHKSKMTDLNLTFTLPFERKGWTITPSMNYVRLLSDDIQAAKIYDGDSDYWFFGIGLSTKF